MPSVEQPPMAANGSLPATLPPRVVGFKQIDAKVLPFGAIENLADETHLIDARRQRTIAHSPAACPAGLADQHVLARKGSGHSSADVVDIGGSLFGANRKVLPVWQDVDGDEIELVCNLPVTQPKFPDVGISHWNVRPCFDGPY